MFSSSVSDSEIITSFSNPNYTLSNDDALNSNQILPDTQYYRHHGNNGDTTGSTDLYQDDIVDITGSSNKTANHVTSSKKRSGYANTDLSQMGLGGGSPSGQSMDSISGATYESVASPADSEGHFSMDSCLTSPTDGLVSVQHTDHDDPDYEEIGGSDGPTTGSGFKGFYATAHESRTALLLPPADDDDDIEETGTGEEPEVTMTKPLLSVKDRLQR